MASLSHSERTTKDNHNFPSSEDTQWLELGLGFSIAPKKQQEDLNHQPNSPNIAVPFPFPVSASASSHPKAKPKPPGSSSSLGLELGLSLGLDHGGEEDHHEIVWRNQHEDHYGDDDDYDDMAWWWPCHMNNPSPGGLNNDWQMPVPDTPHDYSTRTRPHPGLWFTLQSYTNRKGEALPQIPKAYIRVKDENVTIFMVKKYLVTKLGLSNEAEVEIWCMGQKLMQTQTLKQVRDCVWLPSFVESDSFHNYSLQSNCVNNHLMSLCYGRRCAFN
ncbi:hypothetical protein HRI_002982900 [Hibiscus trionum]|uniref:Ubiquitin-like domain-containing protein n=1 Tax=Hibiscus trionum TaxID=183268 RepID=A0A9W7ID47_HIBTR|nr:hypothetical protein HRI_002982900 [Hibiscus trionum]